MTVSFARGTSAAAVFIISAQGAFADVSAQDVWSDWKAYMTGTGYTVTGTESQSGNVLTVSDISMTMPLPEDEGSAGLTMPAIEFVENGDGTVNVMLPKEFPMAFVANGDSPNENFSAEILYTHDGAPMVVSGDTSAMTYDYATGLASVTLGKINAEGEDIPADLLSMTVMMKDLVAKTEMQIAGERSYVQTQSVAELTYDLAFNDPDSDDAGMAKGSIQNLTGTANSIIPTGLDSGALLPDLIKAGFSVTADLAYTGGNSTISVSGSDSFDMATTSAGGKFGVSMSESGLSYDIGQHDITVNVSGSEIPFPLALTMAETGFKLAMPVSKSEEQQDFALGVTLRDFAVPEMLWGMVDPTGALPHDPATIVLDLAGKGKLLFDMLDPEAIEAMEKGDQEPGEFNAVSIKQLLVSAAGAKLTGTGDFTFNNEDLVTFDGMPAPDGTANIQLEGANGLIDNLITMGLVSDSDAMGARMMMGMFGVPGEGEDTLTSEIKVSEDGQIHANGQRIK
ncbi:DUF2125 domain-containing protein [Pseudophaeobacter sp.]|uniref:DUF2125 domain-containing protein n=1 Tax=Pseudophaeobacter sp. TaxID=1971739 RepID=UPI003296A808